MLYDCILTMGDELELVWGGRVCSSTWLFLANRATLVVHLINVAMSAAGNIVRMRHLLIHAALLIASHRRELPPLDFVKLLSLMLLLGSCTDALRLQAVDVVLAFFPNAGEFMANTNLTEFTQIRSVFASLCIYVVRDKSKIWATLVGALSLVPIFLESVGISLRIISAADLDASSSTASVSQKPSTTRSLALMHDSPRVSIQRTLISKQAQREFAFRPWCRPIMLIFCISSSVVSKHLCR